MIKYSSLVGGKNREVLSEFKLDVEGRSFVSNKNIREHVTSIMKLFKSCVSVNPDAKHAKFDSTIYSLLPSAITEIAFNSRRHAGCRLLERCVCHMTDAEHARKRSSAVKLVKMCTENKIHAGLE